MRLIAVAFVAAAASLLPAIAEAQTRKPPLRIVVTPRSYLDAGTVAPVGSLNRYATMNELSPVSSSPQFLVFDSALPPRIGGGRNPFGPIDWGMGY
ncbi:MAG: hypothetical protein ABWZ80_09560 [Beijerinckiaceae bacterium]